MTEQGPWQVHILPLTQFGRAVMLIFPGGNLTIRDFDPAKVTVDTAASGPEYTRAVYKHPMRHGGELAIVHTAQEGVFCTYGMMVTPAFVHWTPPAYFFDRLRMVMLGLVTEEMQDTLA